VDGKPPFLKVHMHDGLLYVLSPWTARDSARVVEGHRADSVNLATRETIEPTFTTVAAIRSPALALASRSTRWVLALNPLMRRIRVHTVVLR
jgi:hypothetical protein